MTLGGREGDKDGEEERIRSMPLQSCVIMDLRFKGISTVTFPCPPLKVSTVRILKYGNLTEGFC